jgi:hypothetical protein
MRAAPVLRSVDLLEESRASLLCAAGHAEHEDARLVVLLVAHDPAASPGFHRKPEKEWLRSMEDVASSRFCSGLAVAGSQVLAVDRPVDRCIFVLGPSRLAKGPTTTARRIGA